MLMKSSRITMKVLVSGNEFDNMRDAALFIYGLGLENADAIIYVLSSAALAQIPIVIPFQEVEIILEKFE